jgi:ABC-type antimicrobial peptide transport system permease subunit
MSIIEGFPFVESVSSREGGVAVKFKESEEVESSSTTLLHLINRERVKDKYVLVPISNKYKVIERIRDNLALLVTIIGGLTLGMGGYLTAHQMVTRIRERVSHIGMLMAVGARREDIYMIFGSELVIITLLGEMLGIIVGVAVSNIIGGITTITPLYNMWDISLTLVVSTLLTMGLGVVVIGSSLKFSVVEALKR